MNRRHFIQSTIPVGLGLGSGALAAEARHLSGTFFAAPPEGPSWSIGNEQVKIVLSAQSKGGVSEFTDLRSQRNFILGSAPLYYLTLIKKGDGVIKLSSLDAELFEIHRESTNQGEILTARYGRHRSADVEVECSVLLEPDSPLSKWRISIKNKTDYGIRGLYYPVIQVPATLSESGKADRFIYPGGEGEMTEEPGKLTGLYRRAQYPGPAAVQMQAYYDDTAGLYQATYDDGGNVKHFGLARTDAGFDLTLEHNYDERPGQSFALPYETVVGVFHGDWYEAADLYKEWASKQYWCAKKISQRSDIPDWVKEPRPVLEYECRADYQRVRGETTFPNSDYPNGKFWPAKKVVPLSKRYAAIFGTPVTVWYNGWEKFGNPAGPVDTFPPLEGAEGLRDAMEEVRKDGFQPVMAAWGNHWHYKRSAAGYDGWARFEAEGRPLAALNDKGEVVKSGGIETSYVPLCSGSEKTQKVFVDYFQELMNFGAVGLEFDHQAWPTICYSDKHGHPPGYGAWMCSKTTEFLRKIRQTAKHRNPQATLSTEGAYEPWIQEVDFMLNRPYQLRKTPLFTYLYHEYIPLLGGDGRFEVSHPDEELMLHALNFVYGHFSFVMVGSNDYDFEANPNYPIFNFLNHLFEAQRTYAHKYLLTGSMLKPVKLKSSRVTVDAWLPPEKDTPDPPRIEVPRVIHGAWKSADNKLGYLLVNWSAEPDNATLTLASKVGPVVVTTGKARKSVSEASVKSGEIVVSVPARNVVLVEQG